MILLAVALLAAAPSAPAAPRGRLALTISGGVSLGNYEAGLTWAVVRYLRLASRQTDFAAVTGASAGATNALLAAAMWCEDPSETRDEDPDKNLFHDLWAPVGLEELLPDDESAFNVADGLLTAAPLERAFRRVRAQLFGHGGLRFRPGCAVSVGITVTRDRPEDRQVAGLRAGTQRFVIPLRFEVDASGRARVVPAPLAPDRESARAQLLLGEPPGGAGIGPLQASEAMLASGAFPFAFRPRELCDCARECPEEDVVRDGSCEGPDFGQRIAALSCNSFAPTAPRQLCRRRYIDGGIFDNAPVGLAVDLAETAGGNPLPFAPTVYLVVDPDHRRLEPESARPAMSGLAAPAELLSTLIATARASELGRAIRDERWQRTTQSTLAEAAQLQAEAAAVQEEMARIAGAGGGDLPTRHTELFRSPRREALGSFLLRCLGDLRRAFDRPGDVARDQFASCAEALRDGTAGASQPHASRPSPADVVALARALTAVFASSSRRADRTLAELGAAETPFDRQLLLLAEAHDVSTIGVASFRFLIGEVPGIADSGLSEVELLQLQRDLLVLAGVGGRLLRATSSMLRVLLSASLLEEQVEGTLPSAAADARAELDAGRDPNFDSAPLRAMAAASDRIARLVALAPRLRNLSVRAASISSNAAQLSSAEGVERQLVLSRRFSPLGGGTLLNFSAFLDRPLRELDFYVGVYDAAVQFASHDCEIQGPYAMAERPAPIFRADAPLQLDRSAADTQRCLGLAVRSAVEALRLRRSARAAFVIARLARLEVTANLGSRSAGARMLAEPSWSWLGDPQLPPDDQLGRALTAVTSRTAPCRAGAEEPLCLSELTFEGLLDGLQLSGYVAQSPSMRDAISDRDRWTARLAGKLVTRAAAVELALSERAHRPPSDMFLTGLRLGELWARRAHGLSAAPRFDPDPSTIPERTPAGVLSGLRFAAHVLPYRVSLDVVRGGAAFSWVEPSLRLLPSFSIDSIADLLSIDGSGRLSSTLGLLPTARFRGLALGVGAQTTIPWNGERVLVPGVLARIAWLQERLALTGGVRSLESGKQQFFATVSVSDLNGLAYWLALWGAIRK